MISSFNTDPENDISMCQIEEEKKLYYLTKLYTKINKNKNKDLYLIADKGINFNLSFSIYRNLWIPE